VDKLGTEFAIHKVGRTNSINVVLLCNMESFGFRIHFQNPILHVHVHNVYDDNILIFLRIAARSTVDHEKKIWEFIYYQ